MNNEIIKKGNDFEVKPDTVLVNVWKNVAYDEIFFVIGKAAPNNEFSPDGCVLTDSFDMTQETAIKFFNYMQGKSGYELADYRP